MRERLSEHTPVDWTLAVVLGLSVLQLWTHCTSLPTLEVLTALNKGRPAGREVKHIAHKDTISPHPHVCDCAHMQKGFWLIPAKPEWGLWKTAFLKTALYNPP